MLKPESTTVFLSLVVILICSTYFYMKSCYSKRKKARPMANNGLLFVSSAAKVHNVCQVASKLVKKVLYINVPGNNEEHLPTITKQIVNLYSKAATQCNNLDVRLMLKSSVTKPTILSCPVEVIMYDNELAKDVEKLKETINVDSNCQIQPIGAIEEAANIKGEPVEAYEYVALGGTFDRLHNGHKILLSQAVLRSTRHLAVGVTDVNMIQSKTLWELIEPVEQRINVVLSFLRDINPNLEYNVFCLKDLYGPTKDDPRYQLLVVSEETVRGATKINEKRKELGLKEMKTYVIQMADDEVHQAEEEAKISSSNHRMRLLGTFLKPPVPNPLIPDWPYVIGLAGGIASGKSGIANKLREKGAAVIDCDILAHELYKPGLPLNQTIAETFGERVITSNGDVDRKALGEIVFNDKSQLDKLNQICWPAIIEEVKRRIAVLGEQGQRIVVLEAAVMVRAGWYLYCHQLWSAIIPPQEAILRLQARNKLTEEEARQRVEAQPSNLEQIAMANVVFSPYWSYEFTQTQVDRAWDSLQHYLESRA